MNQLIEAEMTKPLRKCETCRCDLTCKSKNLKRFTANLQGTNVKLGMALRDIGWEDVGPEKLWSEKRCCRPCVSILQRWDCSRNRLSETNIDWMERTGGRGLPTIPKFKKMHKNSRAGLKEQIITHVQNSHYSRALRLLKCLKGAKEFLLHDFKRSVRQEIKRLETDKTLFSTSTIKDNSGELEWDKILDKIKSKVPTLYTAFYAAISTSDYKVSRPNKDKIMKSRLGMMFLIPLHHRRQRYHKIPRLLPLTFARTLFRCDLKQEKPKPWPTRKKKVNSVVKSWQTSIEETLEDHGTLLAGADMHPGYSLVINSRSSKSQYGDHTVYNAFAVKNRLSFRELQDDTTVKASDLPLKTYLPSQTDYEELRMRMRVLVERILKANLDVFSHQSILEHIPHQYSKECSRKSEYVTVNLGKVEHQDKDPKGMLKILTNLSKLIPNDYDMPLHADQETITVVDSARKAASKDSSTGNHINQLHPVPQDLRAAVVRDTIADLFTPTQATEKGTLRHLKEMFGHENVNEEVSSFHSAADFLLFIACAFVVGFAKEILRKPSPSRSKPKLGPIADEIVRRIWYQLPMNRVADILNAPVKDHDDQFCFCKEDVEESGMIECCNIDCPNGRWFHQNCVMDVEAEGEWFCSSQCEQSNMGLFCICRQKGEEGTDLTWRCANKSCQRGERFHYGCVRSTLPVQEDDVWYCSTECAKRRGRGGDERDELMEYLQRVTWCSLFSECIRDAEREGDGLASIAYWRISMPELFARGHDQHVAATHRLLAGTSGCFPPRIREEVIHNRTVNLPGGKGTNSSLNFSTEQMNNLKEAPSSTQRKRASRSKQKGGKSSGKLDDSAQRFSRYQDDVMQFLYNFGDMFCEMKGRVIPSLCNKIVGQEITQKKATAMKKSLLKLNKKFDKEMMK